MSKRQNRIYSKLKLRKNANGIARSDRQPPSAIKCSFDATELVCLKEDSIYVADLAALISIGSFLDELIIHVFFNDITHHEALLGVPT